MEPTKFPGKKTFRRTQEALWCKGLDAPLDHTEEKQLEGCLSRAEQRADVQPQLGSATAEQLRDSTVKTVQSCDRPVFVNARGDV